MEQDKVDEGSGTGLVNEVFAAVQFITFWKIIQEQVQANNIAHGWQGEGVQRNEIVNLALIMCEGAEAIEWMRKSEFAASDHIPEFSGVVEELADIVIRIMDLCSANHWPIAEAIIAKMKFNATREFMHGKKF